MVEQVHQDAAGNAGEAAKNGPYHDNQSHLQSAEPQVDGNYGRQQRDAVSVKVLKGMGTDQGRRHHGALSARLHVLGLWLGRTRTDAGCTCHRIAPYALPGGMGRIIHADKCNGVSVFVKHLLEGVPVTGGGEAEHEQDVGKRAIFADFANGVQIKIGWFDK